MRLLRDLWVTSRSRTALAVFLIVLGAAGSSVALALAGSVLVDRSVLLFTVLAGALGAIVLSDVVVGLIAARLTADWAAEVRRGLNRVAFGQDIPTLENTPVGELLDRIDSDVYQVASELRGSGVRIAQSLAVATLSIVTAFFVWWPAGLAMIAVAVLIFITMNKPIQRISAIRIAEEEAWSDLAAVMEEAIHGQDDVRTSLAAPYVLRLYADRAREVLSRGRRVWRTSSRVTMGAGTITRTLIASLVVVGAWALATGHIDGARLTGVWLLALGFGGTLEQITRMVPELQNALGAWGRVQMLRAVPQEPSGGRAPADGDLIVRDLTFRYGEADSGRPPALRGVTLTFARGRSYTLIGRTGSGKSTLAKVLTRAVDVPPGTVFLGGVDLNDLDVEGLRRWTAIVPQRTEILAGTLAENIALFDEDLLPRAGAALDELGLSSWVAGLPDGIGTRLGEGGYKLSAGQEQLVAFARILVRDPQVVILDEATARMDPVTESWVQQATDRLLRGRIGVIVAHRLSSVQRCDEVVVLADGEVLEAGPLRESRRFAELMASSNLTVPAPARDRSGGVLVEERHDWDAAVRLELGPDALSNPLPTVEPPPLPTPPRTRTMREIVRLATNDARYGLGAVSLFVFLVVFGLDGAVLPVLWSRVVDGVGNPMLPAVGIAACLIALIPTLYFTGAWFPEWWVRQMLRISLRLVHGQIGPRRVSKHTPAEVVAQGGDTERVVMLADNLIDNGVALVVVVAMTLTSRSPVPALFFVGTMLLSGLAATLFGPRLEQAARRTVGARAAFATALVSALSAARTVKLAGATEPVLAHLAKLDARRSELQWREIAIQVWARSTPSIASGLLPIGVWSLYLTDRLSAAATLVAVATLGSARWFAWTTASLVSHFPSARVWTARTVAMTGSAEYTAEIPGVDISAGTAPAPAAAARNPLRTLQLRGFSAVHENGAQGVRDIDLTVDRGDLVLVVGPVGSGKSSLLRALAGIVHHTGDLCWNGEPVNEPELFLRPNQVGYVAQLPRVLSGTVADNIRLGHEVDAEDAVTVAQLRHDLSAAGGGLQLLIGHKGTRLSGGQLQRLALARALAPRTELLIADDVSSALDVTTELELWRALRSHGVTVVGSTSKRAALAQADRVVVLIGGKAEDQGTWAELEDRWGHLAG
ncbi:Multidrug resistance protein 1 [Actinoplanes sp. SE50/110]|uniref:ATP-binding cassette domain-containing protein n=1 Tax=Actinoplanes sp. (strain ATCC 31044 / CBS 674.73 / SE50/110) TaxID=134676 RepID=UPI00023ECE59|nr:ABC transporter ATP-binding protein/permease [Actinoplanes sp. SE50/110]AEV83797.1 Multidrug resistance protein 1 [Actinoplanes sp. SE50/110]SLL99467.1 ABC transporter [Actinoplanes sp. SE50/110]